MPLLDKILQDNASFVENGEYRNYTTTKYPSKKLVILSCMDTRLLELLPRAMNVKNGDVKIIKNAGAVVSHPFGSIMRSILVALYELNASEVCVVGHHDCGMSTIRSHSLLEKAIDRGIPKDRLDTLKNAGIDLHGWLKGFDSVVDGVHASVDIIAKHPLLPPHTAVHGLVIDPTTGKLDLVHNGYEAV